MKIVTITNRLVSYSKLIITYLGEVEIAKALAPLEMENPEFSCFKFMKF